MDYRTLRSLDREQLHNYCKMIMGDKKVEKTRNYNAELPINIDSYYEECKNNWKKTRINITLANQSLKDVTTLPKWSLKICGDILTNYIKLRKNWIGNINILDPFAGNGVASKVIYDKLKNNFTDLEYIASDFQDLTNYITENSHNVEFNIDCVESIIKYQQGCEILILVCPPPYSFNEFQIDGLSDYFAFREWNNLSKKVFIFIGELGRTDGTEGMYKFLMEHPNWKLVYKHLLASANDIFDRYIEKEIFIFENTKYY